jgi:hypothetical protein
MKLQGSIRKSRTSKYWLSEVLDLDLVTQGKSRRDAASMLRDATELLVNHDGFQIEIAISLRASIR